MLTIEFDPAANPLRDNQIDDAVAWAISQPHSHYCYSNVLVIHAFRAAIARDMIDPADIEFVVEGQAYHADRSGRLLEWPKGLGDQFGQYMEAIILWNVKEKTSENPV